MPRPRTRWFCRWKPRRTKVRTFTARDAARIMCEATKDNGATERQMVLAYREKCKGEARPRSELEEAAEIAVQAMGEQSGSMLETAQWLEAVAVVLGLLALILGRFRRVLLTLAPRLAAAIAFLEAAPALARVMRARRAANDAAFNVLREALRRAA